MTNVHLRVVAAVAAAALSVSLPATSVADPGGVPSSTKPCKIKAKDNGPKKPAKNTHGKKCGFNNNPAPLPPPDTGTETGITPG